MAKLYEIIYKTMLIILGIGTTCCFVMATFAGREVNAGNPVILVTGIFVYVGLISIFYQKCRQWTDKKLDCLAIIMLAVFLILTLVFGLGITSERPADIFNLHNAAVSYLRTGKIGNNNYFSVYPFQLNHTGVLIAVYKLGSCIGITDYRTSGTLYGAALLLLSAFLVYKTAGRIKDKCLGATALLVYVTNPVFWIYSSYYYTDLAGMVFLLLIIDMGLCVNAKGCATDSWLFCMLLGIAAFAGYQFRATAVIGAVAVLTLGIVRFTGSNEKSAMIKNFIFFLMGCVAAMAVYQRVTSVCGVELNKELHFPVTHCIMMGLSEESGGRWSSELWNYTYSFPTYGEKIAANMAAIKSSLSDMGAIGLLKLIFHKLIVTWCDGMTALTTNFKTSVHYGRLYEYTIGNRNVFMRYCTQIMRGSLLLCTIPYLFHEMKHKFSRKTILAVAFFGYMLFYLLWEVHEKYVLMFLPLLIIMAVYGIDVVSGVMIGFSKITVTGDQSYVFDKSKLLMILKKICMGVCAATILLFVLYWNNMTVRTEKKYNYVVYQSGSTGSISVGSGAVRQTFLAEMGFNGVYIRFLNQDIPQDQQYMFALYNDSDVCLYQEVFAAGEIEDNTYHPFCFGKIPVKGGQRFYCEVSALGEYEKTLEICSAGDDYSDYYAGGECSVSGAHKGDMTFRVYDIEHSGYYPGVFYIMAALTVLLMEGVIYIFIRNISLKE